MEGIVINRSQKTKINVLYGPQLLILYIKIEKTFWGSVYLYVCMCVCMYKSIEMRYRTCLFLLCCEFFVK